jgi:nicotinamide mononucleotide transporter
MDLTHWLNLLAEQFRATDIWQWIAVIFGVAEVLLARANSVLLYPAGIIGTIIGITLLYDAKLYAECGLNFYYIVISFYGWFHWWRRKGEEPLPISPTNHQEWRISALIIIGGGGVVYFLLKNFTPSDVPLLDAFVTATAWAGTYLLTRRKIENWVLLNVSNIVAIPLLVYKGLPLFAVLTLILFVVACFGYFDWKKIYRMEIAQQKVRPDLIS